MRKLIACSVAALAALTITASADLSVKDGSGATQTVFNFVCFTTKLCNGTVLINSSGTEISPATAGNQTTMIGHVDGLETLVTSTNTKLDTLNGNVTAAIPAGTAYIGKTRATDGTNDAVLNACETVAQTSTPISITTATTTRIVAPTSAKKTYICYLFLTSAAADNVAIVEGTGGTCGSSTAGVIGGTTAANGPNFAANGGVALSNGGKTSVAETAGTNVDLCLITSAATPLAGVIKWVQL